MNKEEIKLGDWDRILFGEGPPSYLLEVVVRVAVVYILIFVSIRFMGKRVLAEMDRADLVARVSLAAAVGLPIQRPGRGLLVAIVIVMVIIFVGRWLSGFAFRNPKFEKAFQGVYAALVSDGVMDLKRMKKIQITRERLFAALRTENIRHLGQVKRFYMEASGEFSLVSMDDPKPGLSIIPDWDPELRQRQSSADIQLCRDCGFQWELTNISCNHCGGKKQETAILLKKS